MSASDFTDLLIIGGGINGAGVARDAAGRGLSVRLVEAGDLASQTSSASTKLIHGGLRYLEYHEFRLVREALAERERLLAIAPHIIWPLRFVLPCTTGSRPAWLIRLGLFLYDHIGGRRRLPSSDGIKLGGTALGAGLNPAIERGFAYSDCWVEDSRLVILNARDAADRGADIRTRTRFVSAVRGSDRWRVMLRNVAGCTSVVHARAIVNAAGAGVGAVLGGLSDAYPERPPRLIKGSHIVVPRHYAGDHALILQNEDGRIVFAIPYEGKFTLIGTTDVDVSAEDGLPAISTQETDYLCESVNRYFARPVRPTDVVWSYSGVRALYDDGRAEATSVTRDYVLRLGFDDGGPQLLTVFGGKITTYRRLAEEVLEKLAPDFRTVGPRWTDSKPLPGGAIPQGNVESYLAKVRRRWPFIPEDLICRLVRAYGTEIERILADVQDIAALGRDCGGGLTEVEVRHLVTREWAMTPDDILWRRSKLGLHTNEEVRGALAALLTELLPDVGSGGCSPASANWGFNEAETS